jgi:hypothetical protein
MALTAHPEGNYSFLPGIAPYSCGVVANPGFEIVQVTFLQPVAVLAGFDRIASFLKSHNRPKAALCAMSLRSPRPFTFDGFADFNRGYAEILQQWGVFVNDVNPIARTNVAPAIDPPSEPSVYGFSYTQPNPADKTPTFVVAGAGELPEGILARESIVALGDTSPAGIATKARFVMDLMESRLRGLGADWSAVTTTNVYTIHSLLPLLPEVVLGRIKPASMHGLNWHFSRPPIEEIEYEMDLRGTQTELRCN